MKLVDYKFFSVNAWLPARNWQLIALLGGPLLLFAMSGTGCRKSAGTVPVHGRLSYKGMPLAASSVTFFPTTGRPVTATSPQGEYSTELMPGEYTVVVSLGIERPADFKEGDPDPKPKVVLPDVYTARANSTLKATVAAGQDQPINFDLK